MQVDFNAVNACWLASEVVRKGGRTKNRASHVSMKARLAGSSENIPILRQLVRKTFQLLEVILAAVPMPSSRVIIVM